MGDAKPDEEAAVASAPVAPAGAHERLRAVIGPACLAASILLFSANNSVLAWLLDKGPPYFTSCNILCASNLVALGGFPLLFRQDLTRRRVGSVTRKQWVGMLLSSVLANVIGALLNVEGLAKTRSVALVAIMGRLESVWFLGLALVFLGARFNAWIAGNALLLLVGVVLALVEPTFEGGKVRLNTGVLFLLLSGFGYVGSLFVLKAWLQGVPLGVLALFRVAVGTLFYHLLAYVQGSTTAEEALYDWHLWRCMLWFGVLFVLVGQALWLVALRQCDPGLISLGTSFMFILNMVWAAILLRRFPSHGEYLGGAVIFVSVVSGLWEERWALRHKKAEPAAADDEGGQEAEAPKGQQRDGTGAAAAMAEGADEARMQNKYV